PTAPAEALGLPDEAPADREDALARDQDLPPAERLRREHLAATDHREGSVVGRRGHAAPRLRASVWRRGLPLAPSRRIDRLHMRPQAIRGLRRAPAPVRRDGRAPVM